MIFGRILGWVFLAGALFAIANDVSLSIKAGAYISLALGELWHTIQPISLLMVQDWIQQDDYLGLPWLWDPGITTVLLWPGWAVLGVFGLGLQFLFRRRPRR
ncbi:MAG: hypothetical protein HOB82_00095 [Alphaproteobacteria bacterium]|mgnify:CR=1 FL=1|jgi:hypothetical protein|nr:hypothetical protein [Alphaproteobacteria bacterium]MBT5861174.1 hypothetical protein [Alphaproteobacteria bacterium]